jgi:hypothetical protein
MNKEEPLRRVTITLVAGLLVLASCGGSGDDTTTTAAAGGTQTTAPSQDGGGGGGGGDNGGGGDADFCDANSDFDPMEGVSLTADPESLRNAIENAVSQIDEIVDRAPGEIRDDVEVLAGGMRDLADLLDEYDYSFTALMQAFDEGSLELPFDDAAFEEAADNIAEYCGIDPADAGGDTDTTSGGVVGGPGVDLPDDFPADLVPPDSTVEGVFNAGGVATASFTTTADFDELVAYYTDQLGEPLATTNDQVSWSTFGDSGITSVTIVGNADDVTNVIVAVGDPLG